MHSSQQPTGALPASVAVRVESRLADTATTADIELFLLRLQRWWPDLHDGLASVYGARAEDTAARLVELADYYTGQFPGSAARGVGLPGQPRHGDRRISGTSASLAGIEADDERGVARVLLGHALTFGWGGIPVTWSGDELALLDDPDWAAEPATAATTAGRTARG